MRSTSQFPSKFHGLSALLLSAVTVAGLLQGCAGSTAAPVNAAPSAPSIEKTAATVPAEVLVEQRSDARWKLMLAGNYGDAYAYLAPSLRAVISKENYVKGFGPAGLWVSTALKSVECATPERCLTILEVAARVVAPGASRKPTKGQVQQTWIFEEGNWWLYEK